MSTNLELLLRLKKMGHHDIANALRKGQVGKLSDRQRLILADTSICVKMARKALDSRLLAGALVVVTTSGWGGEPEVTVPGIIQPLMNL
ncbi:hypothetical protein [Neptunomonas sp.]|uniref:hypothetical protein n=1 Tax=Neptunomonas TaxID=75687 RepID=UPI003515F70D